MGLFSRLMAGELHAGTPGPADDFWYQPAGGIMTPAGMRVDEEGAQKLSAWYRGRDILATVLAMLPFPIYQRLPNDGGAEPAIDHPLYDVLHDQTNDVDDAFQWKRSQMFDLIDHGHGYNWIVEGQRGFAHQLVPIEPTLVTPKRLVTTLPNGAVIPGRELFDVRDPNTGRTSTFTQDEIFHLRGAGGKGILEHARSSLGTALATETYAGTVFGRGTLNGGVIENPGVLDEEPSKRMATSFITAAGDWRLPKILEQGSTFKESKMSPEDFQMLLSRKFSVDDIARWLGVPRQMLENSDPSFGNAGQFDQNFLTYSMGGWLSLFEFAVNGQLILAPKKYFARFTRQALLRGNFKDRVEGLVALKNAAIISADEARAVEDMNKRGGRADELVEPQNITGKPAAADPAADPTPGPPTKKTPAAAAEATDDRVRAIVTESAGRLLRKELLAAQKAAVRCAADSEAFAAWATGFYAPHVFLMAQVLQIDELTARLYCDDQRDQLIGQGLIATEAWTTAALVGLALDAPRPDRRDELLRAALERPQPDVHTHTTIAKDAIAVSTPITFAADAMKTQIFTAPARVEVEALTVEAPLTLAAGAITVTPIVEAPRLARVDKTVSRDPVTRQIAHVVEQHVYTEAVVTETTAEVLHDQVIVPRTRTRRKT